MVIMTKLVQRLRHDYPQYTFVAAERARWSASEQTIYYTDDDTQTLHELGHALLHHNCYHQDVELLHIERAAWQQAQQLGQHYRIAITDETVEDALDSYREWLHQRSCCPNCGLTGLQSRQDLSYHCPNCQTRWIVNDGRNQQIRRFVQ